MEQKLISFEAMNEWAKRHGTYFADRSLGRYHYVFDAPLSRAFEEYGVDGDDDSGLFCFVGKDGERIRTGDTVFGENGEAWNVIGIGGTHHPIIAVKAGQRTSDGRFQRLKPKWLTHERPARKPRDIAALMERFADENEYPDRDTLRQWAKELRAGE